MNEKGTFYVRDELINYIHDLTIPKKIIEIIIDKIIVDKKDK